MVTEKANKPSTKRTVKKRTATRRSVKKTRVVRTRRGLREYTYLGCPLTRNRSPWCFRLCNPDLEGHGQCGRIAPHSFKGRIQLGIERYNAKQKQAHCEKLESMYLAAPCNQYYEPGIRVSEGEAEVVIPIQKKFLDAAGSVHESVCHRAMNDAALLAVSSLVPKALTRTTSFAIQLSPPFASGELVGRGRFIGMCEDQYLAEAVLSDKQGQEFGRGSGAFVKSKIPLSPEMGYK